MRAHNNKKITDEGELSPCCSSPSSSSHPPVYIFVSLSPYSTSDGSPLCPLQACLYPNREKEREKRRGEWAGGNGIVAFRGRRDGSKGNLVTEEDSSPYELRGKSAWRRPCCSPYWLCPESYFGRCHLKNWRSHGTPGAAGTLRGRLSAEQVESGKRK